MKVPRWHWAILVFVGWYGMMAMHELGHIVSASINGAIIERVELVPWAFSQTVRYGSKHPVIDVWAGAVVGGRACGR